MVLPIPLGGAALMWYGATYHDYAWIGVGAGLAVVAGAAFPWLDRIVVISRGPFCTKCEYDLTAVEGEVCPECGAVR